MSEVFFQLPYFIYFCCVLYCYCFFFIFIVVFVVYKELVGFVSFVVFTAVVVFVVVVFTAVVVFVVVVFTVVCVVSIVHHILPGGVCHSRDAPLRTVPPNIQEVGK